MANFHYALACAFGNLKEAKDKFGSAFYKDFSTDVSYVSFCSVVCDVAFFGDLGIVEAFADELCDLDLAWC